MNTNNPEIAGKTRVIHLYLENSKYAFRLSNVWNNIILPKEEIVLLITIILY